MSKRLLETSIPSTPSGAGGRWHARIPHILGIGWVLAAAIATMVPALNHGVFLGPFDILSRHGLSARPGTVVHNPTSADLITEMIPWTAAAWTQVHHGHLPLWNPYSAEGMPLAFNWQSATFSLPALVGYLMPLRLAFTAQVLVTLVVGGIGAYVLGFVIRLGALGCTMAGVLFVLNGYFFVWLGWPVASVMSWAGWLFAAGILIVRGRNRGRAIACFALVLALAIYAGQPDALVVLLEGLAVFVGVILVIQARRRGGARLIVRPVKDLAVASVAGLALGAPLLLPGLQLASRSVRATRSSLGTQGLHSLMISFFQSFDGVPVAGSRWPAAYDTYVSAYLGVIAVVFAAVAIAKRRRDPHTIAFAVVGLVAAAIAFEPLGVSILNELPWGVRWLRNTIIFGLAVSMLAGMGIDVLVRSAHRRAAQRWVAGGFAATAVALALIWLLGRGNLPPFEAAARQRSFIWPVIEVGVGAAVVGAIALATKRHGPSGVSTPFITRLAALGGAVLLACETAFLVTAGAPIWSSSTSFLAPTTAEVSLEHAVGSSLVGFGVHACSVPPSMGIPQDANVPFGVHELDVYDPIAPNGLFRSWKKASGKLARVGNTVGEFCPAVTSAQLARRYGVGFVLEPSGVRGPSGAVFDKKIGDESLYRIPGAAPATLTPLGQAGTIPGPWAQGRPVTVTHPDAASWKMVIQSATPAVLRLHLTDVPGWSATIDGRPLHLRPYSGVMFQARIPAGRETIELHYWPPAFSIGIGLAAFTFSVFLIACIVWRFRPRRAKRLQRDSPQTAL